MNRIVIIGHFGGNKVYNDGQTVKSIALRDALMKKIDVIDTVDTYFIRHNPIKFCVDFAKGIIKNKKIIVVVSSNGRKYLFPILYYFALLFGKEVFHSCIGGRLANEVRNDRRLKKYVAAFSGNWMESKILTEDLHILGVENAVYVPNFKKLRELNKAELDYTHSVPYRFCLFSRVMPEKGIEDAINAVESINSMNNTPLGTLDIYGPIEDDYKDRLNSVLEKASNCKYLGVIPANQSVDVLMHYYCLLFPTHWLHEGIPGTIIDSLTAGVPIISRKWQYCTEMIEDKKTGLIYDFDKPEQLKEMIIYAIKNPNLILSMKEKCLDKSKEYQENTVINLIIQLLE